MSECLPPILDWLESHAPSSWRRPAAVPTEALQALRERGAPEALVEIYANGGHAPGAFPRGSAAEAPLLAPEAVEHDRELGVWWFSGVGDRGRWSMDRHGRVHQAAVSDDDAPVQPAGRVSRGSPVDLDTVLGAHLTALMGGELTWNPHAGQFLYPDERSDLKWTAGFSEADHRALQDWIERTREQLARGTTIEIEGFGSFSVSTRRSFPGFDGTPVPQHRIPIFRAGPELKTLLNGKRRSPKGGPLFAPMARQLAAGERVGVLGLGVFSVSHRRSFTGHNPKTGEPMTVPAVRIPVFRAWPSLKALLAG